MFYIKYYWILYIYCTSAGIFSLFLFIHKQCENAKEWTYYEFDNAVEKEYDFIVGGSAGSIVARRLAENSKHQVLLIEAGGESSAIFDIPLLAPFMQQSYADWKYMTVPQEYACFGLTNNQSKWPAGKIIGGTSRLNYMIYLRGHLHDFESWSQGNDWTYNDILYYFKKSENYIGKKNDNAYIYGSEGPIQVSDMRFQSILANTVLKAGQELHFNSGDFNDMRSSHGFMSVKLTSHNGARWSADQVLKHRLHSRLEDNLRILTNTLVEKVLFKNGFEAIGVQVKRNGKGEKILARKSVVLSAGTVGTAKILLLSGIGPENHLRQHEIQPLVNLPVGENLQDHVTTGLDLIIINETLPFSSSFILKSPLEAYNYLLKGEGILTHPGCEVIGLFNIKQQSPPDLQLMVIPTGISSDGGAIFKNAMGISEKLWQEYFISLIGQQVISIVPTLLHPKSRGFVRLKSSDPADSPIIDPKYLSNPQDIEILVEGLKLIAKIIKTKSFAQIGARFYDKLMPGCDQFNFGSDLYWKCYVKHLTLTAYHPVGTCKMGNDHLSVVDHDLRVHRMNRLHIIDASVMPTMPSANINAAIMMIAEKGADLIKRFWHLNRQSCHFMELFISPSTTLVV